MEICFSDVTECINVRFTFTQKYTCRIWRLTELIYFIVIHFFFFKLYSWRDNLKYFFADYIRRCRFHRLSVYAQMFNFHVARCSNRAILFLPLFLLQICLEERAKYIVAPYESDAQMAFFVNRGYADFVLTEDSDLLTYGCKKVYKLMNTCCISYLYY